MIKKILIGVLVVYGLGMTVFANLKANEAERQKQVSEQTLEEAIRASAEANRHEAQAIIKVNEIEKKLKELESKLANCK